MIGALLPLVGAAGVVALFVGTAVAQQRGRAERDVQLAAVARALGARVTPAAGAEPAYVDVRLDGARGRVAQRPVVGSGSFLWTLEVRGLVAGPEIRAESAASRLSARIGATDLVTGDAAFDEAVYIIGPTWPTLACLDAERRRVIQRAVRHGAERSGERWTMTFSARDATPEVVAEMVWLLAAASPDWEPADPGARVAEIVRTDPCEGVRLALLGRLWASTGPARAWGELLARELATRGGRPVVDGLRSQHADEVAAAAMVLSAEGGVADLPALRAVAVHPVAGAAAQVDAAITAIVAGGAPMSAGLLSVVDEAPEGALSRAGGAEGELARARRASEG